MFYPHMPIGKVWIYRLLFFILCFLFVFLFVRLRISPPKIKLAVLKFCTAVHRRPMQEISHFGELCCPGSPKSADESYSAHWAITVSALATRAAHGR